MSHTQFEKSNVATPLFNGHKPTNAVPIYTRISPLSPDVSRGPSGGYISGDKISQHAGNLSKLGEKG
jgi:hypothetical protein